MSAAPATEKLNSFTFFSLIWVSPRRPAGEAGRRDLAIGAAEG
jgi:hypothetical protein